MTGVWITRAKPGAFATAERVREAGLMPFVAPLLEVAETAPGEMDLTGVSALAFTSANAVRAFPATAETRPLPVFAVGSATAQAARHAGFDQVHDAHGNVADLAEAIASRCLTGIVLHPRAEEPAADLVALLAEEGVAARDVVVYRTDQVRLSDDDREAAAACDFVLLHSPKAARALRHLGVGGPRPICLSEAISDALGDPRARIATAPNEDALIGALLEAAR